MMMPFIYHQGAYIKKPVKPLAEFLKGNFKEGDIIAFSNEAVMPCVKFYSKIKNPFYYFFDPQFSDTTWLRPIVPDKLNIPLNRIKDMDFKNAWVIYSSWARDAELEDNARSVNKWMDNNFKIEFMKQINDVWVYRYTKRQDPND